MGGTYWHHAWENEEWHLYSKKIPSSCSSTHSGAKDLFPCHLGYCSPVSSSASKGVLRKFQSVQNRAARLVWRCLIRGSADSTHHKSSNYQMYLLAHQNIRWWPKSWNFAQSHPSRHVHVMKVCDECDVPGFRKTGWCHGLELMGSFWINKQ